MFLSITGCSNQNWHADGYCDDVNNNEACFFDGGDCCGSNVNTDWCDECLCLEWGKERGQDTITPSGWWKEQENLNIGFITLWIN